MYLIFGRSVFWISTRTSTFPIKCFRGFPQPLQSNYHPWCIKIGHDSIISNSFSQSSWHSMHMKKGSYITKCLFLCKGDRRVYSRIFSVFSVLVTMFLPLCLFRSLQSEKNTVPPAPLLPTSLFPHSHSKWTYFYVCMCRGKIVGRYMSASSQIIFEECIVFIE